MFKLTIKVDGQTYVKEIEGTKNLFEISSLMNLLAAHFEKAGVSFEYEYEKDD